MAITASENAPVKTVSVIVPVYNEERTARSLVERVLRLDLGLAKEIIVVDDGSSDGTPAILDDIARNHAEVKLLRHQPNRGKGYAVRCGIDAASGEVIIIQDADLEYDPAEYPRLLEPIRQGKADVVYGSRFISNEPKRVLYFWHFLANKFITLVADILTNLNLSDVETCYKVFRTDLLKKIKLKEKRFGFDPEVTVKISHIKQVRIFEVGISYSGRTYAEGKKIGWLDAFRILYVLVKYSLFHLLAGRRVIYK